MKMGHDISRTLLRCIRVNSQMHAPHTITTLQDHSDTFATLRGTLLQHSPDLRAALGQHALALVQATQSLGLHIDDCILELSRDLDLGITLDGLLDMVREYVLMEQPSPNRLLDLDWTYAQRFQDSPWSNGNAWEARNTAAMQFWLIAAVAQVEGFDIIACLRDAWMTRQTHLLGIAHGTATGTPGT